MLNISLNQIGKICVPNYFPVKFQHHILFPLGVGKKCKRSAPSLAEKDDIDPIGQNWMLTSPKYVLKFYQKSKLPASNKVKALIYNK